MPAEVYIYDIKDLENTLILAYFSAISESVKIVLTSY